MTRSDLLSPSMDFRGPEGDGGAYRRELVRADMEALGSWLSAVTDELRQERMRASTLAQRAEDRLAGSFACYKPDPETLNQNHLRRPTHVGE